MAKMLYRISKFPRVLVLHLKRFGGQIKQGTPSKSPNRKKYSPQQSPLKQQLDKQQQIQYSSNASVTNPSSQTSIPAQEQDKADVKSTPSKQPQSSALVNQQVDLAFQFPPTQFNSPEQQAVPFPQSPPHTKNEHMTKIEEHVEFPLILDLSKYMYIHEEYDQERDIDIDIQMEEYEQTDKVIKMEKAVIKQQVDNLQEISNFISKIRYQRQTLEKGK
ncbi:MAG: hypothetical protein EZS28_017689 [Streblomastix strix]|uniref:Uncharacterized protein n=1 Tax=Streblomastix strix TaxID=222440 RepID=A0A5J4VVQ4_9EUKA|nr:MAG: hypothetical protein EZS28_017689 [Streblomastix strix]